MDKYIFHDLITISDGLTPKVEAQVEINLSPEDNFIPGLGSPLIIFTLQDQEETVNLTKSRAIYLNFKKFFFDHILETNFRTFYDLRK